MESRYRPLLVVTPAFNEADTLDAVVAAVARQTRRPDEWVIVDDGSTDETAACIRRAASRYPWIRFVALTDPAWTTADRLAEARPARAFSAGVASATITWGYVAKLDADVQLPPDYYEFLLGKLATDPDLGMTGGTLVEPAANGRDRVISVPSQHVPGAVSVYRRSCFERIGGVRETLGWDTVDETLARMHGFTTRSYRDVVARHLRPTGAVSGVVRGRARHGKAAWIVHYPLYFAFLRALKLTLVSPRPLLGFAFLWGYLGAAARRVTRIPDADYQAYARRELRARTLQRFRVRT